MLNQIKNYVQLTPTIGTSGQPTADQFSVIADAGYQSIINLAMPDSDYAIATEGSIVTTLGMAYIHIPVPFEQPTAQHLKIFIQVMDAFADRNVWVHCAANYRVSAFLYHYRQLRQGCSAQVARSPMFERWKPDDVWQAFLDLEHHKLGLDHA
ncbi:hypothetical protein C1752_01659 [Acaryochloris thomasi RCC1774]|uniref:DSP-PTPase phosphatase fused to NAD+ Kinase domain-containing protein n=1 Tax=Acaryochloris thomasi RCC1774 TaxID=1764569 RepID=A0A2W1JKN4_9CYAN|nr:protein tyrosine phosphatase family protein [Acaryochloris thomasi]PZD73973.1 hypothetical protein C1752_01659 [Acaryochloris thomasi RCC1774]